MNWLLIAVAAFWFIMAIVGIKKGFLRMLYSISAFFISLILTFVFYSQVAVLICEKTQFDEMLYEKYTSYIENSADENEPSFLIKIAESMTLDTEDETVKAIAEFVEEKAEDTEETIAEVTEELKNTLTVKLVTMTINVVSFILTLLIVGVALLIILNVIKIVEKIPVIKGMNRILGLVLGVGMGLMIIWLVFVLITVLAATDFGNACLKCISESEFLTWIYKINIFKRIL